MHDFIGAFFDAVKVGLLISSVVGPIAVFFIKKTIEFGLAAALSIGLAIIVTDVVYALAVAVSLTAIYSLSDHAMLVMQFMGGVMLLYMGVSEYKGRNAISSANKIYRGSALRKLFYKTATLNILSPLTFICFSGALAAMGDTYRLTFNNIAAILLGIIVGSAVWWLCLGIVINMIAKKVPPGKFLNVIRTLSSIAIFCFGIYAVCKSTIKIIGL